MSDTYSHPAVTKARQVYDDLAEKSTYHPYVFRDPEVREAYAGYIAELERIGDVYITHVEITFPPQVKAKYDKVGVVVDVYDILKWIAADPEWLGNNQSSDLYLKIAEEYYAPDNYDDEDEDPEEGSEPASEEGDDAEPIRLAS